jgi:DNA-directed RNA polymerase specialized sigma24 family protein
MNQPISSCTPCLLRALCTQPCPDVEALLPHEDHGRVEGLERRHKWLYGMRLDTRRAYVRRLLDGRHVLRGRMKRAFNLRYNDGLSIEEIARKMHLSPSGAGTYLRRARRKARRAACL